MHYGSAYVNWFVADQSHSPAPTWKWSPRRYKVRFTSFTPLSELLPAPSGLPHAGLCNRRAGEGSNPGLLPHLIARSDSCLTERSLLRFRLRTGPTMLRYCPIRRTSLSGTALPTKLTAHLYYKWAVGCCQLAFE